MMILIIIFSVILIFLVYFLKKDNSDKGVFYKDIPYGGAMEYASSAPKYSSGRYNSNGYVNNYDDSDKYNYTVNEIRTIPKNPLLEYQYVYTQGRQPVTLDDPIIPPTLAGPLINSYSNEYGSYSGSRPPPSPYGPYPGRPLNIPIPQGSLKTTSEKWKYPFYSSSRPLEPFDFFKPYGPNQKEMQISLGGGYADDPYYTKNESRFFNSRGSFSKQNLPFRDNSKLYALDYTGTGEIPFIGSVNAYAPFAEVNTPWEKAGILTRITDESRNNNEILNLYRQSIAPINDVFKYMVQDRDGFMIPLDRNFLEDGDIIEHIPGKSGKWKVHIYVDNKYIWV